MKTRATEAPYTIAMFCEYLGISRWTWQRLHRDGMTPKVTQVGGRRHIRAADLRRWERSATGRDLIEHYLGAGYAKAQRQAPPVHRSAR